MSKTIYTFVECAYCGAGMHTTQVKDVPVSYDSVESYLDGDYYCVGEAHSDAYCRCCGANGRD